jgi:hypothetical protein
MWIFEPTGGGDVCPTARTYLCLISRHFRFCWHIRIPGDRRAEPPLNGLGNLNITHLPPLSKDTWSIATGHYG